MLHDKIVVDPSRSVTAYTHAALADITRTTGLGVSAARHAVEAFAATPAAARETTATPAAAHASAVPATQAADYVLEAQAQQAALSPTVSEFLNGAISEYVLGGEPDGMKPFLVNGQQLTLSDDLNGAFAHTWITAEHQVLITFSGTTRGENILVDPAASVGGLLSDLTILQQKTSSAELESLGFARQVLAEAAKQGFASSQVFVTGHSLGGIEAEYVAQQTGLAGIGFEPTGIRPDATAIGIGGNFVSVVTDGDPVGNYGSDIKGEQPFAPRFVAQGGQLPHYGTVLQIGAASDQAALSKVAALVAPAFSGDSATFSPIDALLHPLSVAAGLAEAAALIAEFHLPAAEYTDLGVTPTGGFLSQLPDRLGVSHGAVLPVGNDTIAQLQGYIATHANVGV